VNSFTSISDDNKPHSRQVKAYLWSFAAFSGLLLAVVAATSYWIDPYGVWQSTDSFARKVAASDKVRQIKSYQAAQWDPTVLIVGNSRVQIGMPPEHSFYQGRVYNLGLPGAGVVMQYDYAWHVIRTGNRVQKVLLAIDFVDFLTAKTAPTSLEGDWQTRLNYYLAQPETSQTNRWVQTKEQLSLLLSQSAILDSVQTMVAQSQDLNALSVDGFSDGRLYHNIVRTEGFNALYQQKIVELQQRLQQKDLRLAPASREFLALETFLRLLRQQGIQVTLFVNPYQYHYLDLIEQHGLQDEFLQWKTQMKQLASRYQFALYDFAIRSEPVSQSATLTSRSIDDNPYFWEPAHYRRAFGQLMLEVWRQQDCTLQVQEKWLTLCELHRPETTTSP
jgi:hypothetical protein